MKCLHDRWGRAMTRVAHEEHQSFREHQCDTPDSEAETGLGLSCERGVESRWGQRSGRGLPGMELGAAWLGSGSRKTCFREWGGGLSPCFSPQSPHMSLRNSLPSVSLCFEPRLRPLSPARLCSLLPGLPASSLAQL